MRERTQFEIIGMDRHTLYGGPVEQLIVKSIRPMKGYVKNVTRYLDIDRDKLESMVGCVFDFMAMKEGSIVEIEWNYYLGLKSGDDVKGFKVIKR